MTARPETIPLQGPVYSDLLAVAQRSDEPILIVDDGRQKREFASGIAVTPVGGWWWWGCRCRRG